MPSRPWTVGDPMPPPHGLCRVDEEELRYQNALTHPNKTFGLGTMDNPLVVWLEWDPCKERKADLTVQPSWIWSHNNFAKGIAKCLGLTHAWIIMASHDKEIDRNEKGQKIKIGADSNDKPIYQIVDVDMHITLRFGTGLNECTLSCHAYVDLDGEGNPYQFTEDQFRHYEADERRGVKFWTWNIRRKQSIPHYRLNSDPARSWWAYADTGPYVDYERPGPQHPLVSSVRDTGLRREGIRQYREDSKDIADAVKHLELAGLEKKLKDLLDKVTVLEDPPKDLLLFEWVLKEQIATKRRDIFCEIHHAPCPFEGDEEDGDGGGGGGEDEDDDEEHPNHDEDDSEDEEGEDEEDE
ncbi:hypothetical protein F5Y04DRAFT_280122 [Hypomontagnella monticulosa]|nr:hypothetical protein F5Y04DRAFT_280122 [Hypomontagnella monticulosa]